MAGHFLLSAKARDFSLEHVDRMSPAAVHDFFVRARWGDGGKQTCPSCGSVDEHYWIASRNQWRCREHGCSRVFSVTSGTAFADHKLPLKKILRAIVIFAMNVKGISASALSRQLNVAYQTAFVLMHKLREAISFHVDKTPMKGVIHIDGAHVSGKVRKPRKKDPANKRQARDRYPSHAFAKHPNRRIVMAVRQLYPEPGLGAVRTLIDICYAEDSHSVERLTKQYVAKGATVMTDELGAYTKLAKLFIHRTVNHSNEFSTDEGVSNNQAESFFARVRRFIIGQAHRVTPHYMLDYMNEMAWREDQRRTPPSEQVFGLLKMAMKQSPLKWRHYWMGKDRPVRVKVSGELVRHPPWDV